MPKNPRREAAHKHRTPVAGRHPRGAGGLARGQGEALAVSRVAAVLLEGRQRWRARARDARDAERRRIHDRYPALLRSAPPAAELNRAQDILKSLWAATGRAGKSHPTWRAVMGVLALAQQQIEVRDEPPVEPDRRVAGPGDAPVAQDLPRRYTSPVGAGSPPAGSSVTAKT